VTSFRVLGPIEVWADERRVAVGGPRQVTLLAFLLLNANRALAGDTITDAVWGSSRAKPNRLQMAVARLRHALEPLSPSGDPVIRTVSGGYMIAIAPGQLDADMFDSCVTQAGEALDGHDPDRAAALVAQGLDLWRGPRSPSRILHSRRSGGSTSCAWPRSRRARRRICSSVVTPRSSVS
jgi:DNA-binding SARP family transcriptional activator